MHSSTHHWGSFDLYARIPSLNHETIDNAANRTRRLHMKLERASPERIRQPTKGLRYEPRIFGEVMDRQPGQIDVYRQPWQIVLKEVNRCSALQRKLRLAIQLGEDLNQQTHTIRVSLTSFVKPNAHPDPLVK
jgi:hypothetical protein